MVRTQVQLTQSQAEALRRLSAENGLSIAALIRQAVDDLLKNGGDREEMIRRALAVAGKFRSGKKDISVEHDRYLAEDFLD